MLVFWMRLPKSGTVTGLLEPLAREPRDRVVFPRVADENVALGHLRTLGFCGSIKDIRSESWVGVRAGGKTNRARRNRRQKH